MASTSLSSVTGSSPTGTWRGPGKSTPLKRRARCGLGHGGTESISPRTKAKGKSNYGTSPRPSKWHVCGTPNIYGTTPGLIYYHPMADISLSSRHVCETWRRAKRFLPAERAHGFYFCTERPHPGFHCTSLRSVHVWDLASGKTIREIKAPEDFEAPVAFSRDSRLLATASHRGTIRIWDIDTGMETVPLPGREAGSLAGLMNAGRTVLVHRQEGLRFRDLEDPTWPSTRGSRAKDSTDSRRGSMLALSNDARMAMVMNSRGFFLMDVSRDKELHKLGEPTRYWNDGAAFGPDGKTVACATCLCGNAFIVADVATGKVKWQREGRSQASSIGLAFSPDSKTFVSVGSGDGHRCVSWMPRRARSCAGTNARGPALRKTSSLPGLLPRGMVVGIFSDKDLQLWDPAVPCPVQTLPGVGAFAFSPDGQVLATAGATGAMPRSGCGRSAPASRSPRCAAPGAWPIA